MGTSAYFREGTASQFATAKAGARLLPKSFYLVDGKPHLATSSTTAFAFIDVDGVTQMLAGIGIGGDRDDAGRWREKVESRDCMPICVMSLKAGKQNYDPETVRANKRVHVKSPEMFDVLVALVRIGDESGTAVKKACGTSVPRNLLVGFSVESLTDGLIGRLLIFEGDDKARDRTTSKPFQACRRASSTRRTGGSPNA